MPLKSCSRMRNNMRLKALATLLFAFALAVVAGFDGGASAQRRRAPKPSANDNTAQAPQNDNRPKHVFIGHGSDTASGSRMTVTSDNPLNDYRAYRSGDRFYVELPNANADTAARASGHGFSDMQVQRRGKSVVLSYRIQPGAKPHVEQRFNRLEVVFDASEGAQGSNAAANNSSNKGAASAAENRNPAASEQPAGQTTPTQQNPNSAAERRAAAQAEAAVQTRAAGGAQTQGASGGQAQVVNAGQAGVAAPTSPAGEQPTGVEQPASNTLAQTAEQTPAGAASPAPTSEQQLAQSQPPTQIAPITATDRNTSAPSGASLGTFLLRNWEWSFIIALVIAGFGLILAARRSSAAPPASLEEASLATQTLEESRAPRLQTAPAAKLRGADANGRAAEASKIAETAALPVVAASALVVGAAVEEKEEVEAATVEGAGKTKEAERQAEQTVFAESTPAVAETSTSVNESSATVAEVAETSTTAAEASTILVGPPVDEHQVAEPSAAEPSVVETVAEEPSAEESVVKSVGDAAAVEAASGVAPDAVETGEKFEPEPLVEVAAGSFVVAGSAAVAEDASAKGIAPAAPPEQERVEAETRRLLEGETYDRTVIGTTDALARQLVAAELLSALSGRNAERRERARAAFAEHGYFDELARDLHMAEAPAERAAAARFLAITGNRAATPHLIAALEDESAEVRRASVEALGALRDPAAVRPLERLLESEAGWRNRVPSRVIRHALETCREAATEERAAAPARPAPEVAEVTTAVEPAEAVEVASTVEATEAAPATEAAHEVRAAEPSTEIEAVEAAPEAVAVAEAVELAPAQGSPVEVAGPEEAAHSVAIEPAHEMPEVASVVEESVVALAPVEVAEPEEVTATEEANATVEAPASSAVTAIEAVPPDEEIEEAEASQPPVSQVASEQPAIAQPVAFETFEPVAAADVEVIEPEPEVESVAIEPHAEEAEVTRGESSVEISPVAVDEWFDFDLDNAEHETQPTAPLQTQPAVDLAARPTAEQPSSVFESSSGEALTAEPAARDAAPSAKDVREVEHFAGEVVEAEAARGGFQPGVVMPTTGASEAAPVAETSEKGVAPFDEFSTVPASIQQRLASREADERASAIVELSHVDTDEAFQQICAAFDDDAKEVRAAAARALYELRDDRAESFTRALREAASERRRHIGAAIASSGLAGDAISQLTGESREKTYEAFSLLFLMAKAGEVQPLIRAIEGHPNSEVRLAVVKLLALSGQKEILPAFRRLAVRGSLPTEVRSAVMEAIYQISSSQPSAA
jgi:HEAT repeat protein